MTGPDVVVPGARDVRARLDAADDGATACVVACPPHPRHGGSRSDRRLRTLADALTGRGVDCLRIDYGPWAAGTGERTDATCALRWAGDRYGAVGLFGYSFGASVALVTAADLHEDALGPEGLGAVAALAPAATLADGRDVAAALNRIEVPVHVSYGREDHTVDWAPVVEAAREAGADVRAWHTGHAITGELAAVGDAVAGGLADELTGPDGR